MDYLGMQFHALKEETTRQKRQRTAQMKQINKEKVSDVCVYAFFVFRCLQQDDSCLQAAMEATRKKLECNALGAEAPKCCKRFCLALGVPLPALHALRCHFYSLHSDARRPTSETSIAVILIVHTCREQFIECSAGGQVARKELLITLRDPSSSTSFSVQCQQFPICWKGLQHLLGVSPTLLQAVVGSPNARYSLCFPFQDGKKKHLNSRVLQH